MDPELFITLPSQCLAVIFPPKSHSGIISLLNPASRVQGSEMNSGEKPDIGLPA